MTNKPRCVKTGVDLDTAKAFFRGLKGQPPGAGRPVVYYVNEAQELWFGVVRFKPCYRGCKFWNNWKCSGTIQDNIHTLKNWNGNPCGLCVGYNTDILVSAITVEELAAYLL